MVQKKTAAAVASMMTMNDYIDEHEIKVGFYKQKLANYFDIFCV